LDSGSATTSLTTAEESTYVSRCSALITPEPRQHRRRSFSASWQRQRFWKVGQIPFAVLKVSRRPQPLERIFGQWSQHRYG
jgi:hypothetical protein